MADNLPEVEFKIDKNELYRSESVTDLKTGTIRKMIPVKSDGSVDSERDEVFFGQAQLYSPHGPIPLEAKLDGKTLDEAIASFEPKMREAFAKMYERMMQMEEQQRKMQEKDQSRIIVPR